LKLTVNGDPVEAEEGSSVSSLLNQLDVKATRVAVERNLEIVPKASYAETLLNDGDRIEVVAFVGGG
jgi:thiamine biosynthesis protein ThiS